MVMLRIRDVQYRYHDGTCALMGVTLDIRRGEFLAILGPNGSGKTTLLKHLNGLHKPLKGEILLEEKSLTQYSSKEIFQRVGIVFQDPNDQLFATSVWEDVAFGPMNMGLTRDEINRRVDKALSLVSMTPHVNKGVDALSFGQKKRICIAGVLAMKPNILILDEPTCGLDPAGVTSIMTLLKELNKVHGITIVMATNAVDLVPLYMDRLAVMYRGNILRVGTAEEVFSNTDEIKHACLELPQIGQLMQILRDEDNFPIDFLPIGDARRYLTQELTFNHSLTDFKTGH
jgi:cobalt/nickel transport system ATP-binding protein